MTAAITSTAWPRLLLALFVFIFLFLPGSRFRLFVILFFPLLFFRLRPRINNQLKNSNAPQYLGLRLPQSNFVVDESVQSQHGAHLEAVNDLKQRNRVFVVGRAGDKPRW